MNQQLQTPNKVTLRGFNTTNNDNFEAVASKSLLDEADECYIVETPSGFDTVLGFLANHNPESLDLLPDPVYDTLRDSHWLRSQAKRRGLPIHKVEAPEVMQELGIVTVEAYPLALLRERLD